MDLVSSLLDAPRAREVFVVRSDLVAPWALRIEDDAPLTVVAVVAGAAVLDLDDAEPIALGVGDAVVVRGTRGYTMCDTPATTPQARIGPGQVCTRPDGSPLSDFRSLGVLAWGNVAHGRAAETVLITGTYQDVGQVSRRLVDLLPDVVAVPAGVDDARLRAVVALLVAETTASADGTPADGVVLDRLVDLVLVLLLRTWFAGPDRPRWASADDPVVGAALRRIHHEPDRAWTLASLAADVGVSRATLARQFRAATGEPVIGYLTGWRLDIAADLLVATDLTLEAIARRVGYASAFSLSNAARSAWGRSPAQVRQAARAAS